MSPLILFAERGSCDSIRHFGTRCFFQIWRPGLGYSGFPLFLMTAGRQFLFVAFLTTARRRKTRFQLSGPLRSQTDASAVCMSISARRVPRHRSLCHKIARDCHVAG
jgi:hypothetical protein